MHAHGAATVVEGFADQEYGGGQGPGTRTLGRHREQDVLVHFHLGDVALKNFQFQMQIGAVDQLNQHVLRVHELAGVHQHGLHVAADWCDERHAGPDIARGNALGVQADEAELGGEAAGGGLLGAQLGGGLLQLAAGTHILVVEDLLAVGFLLEEHDAGLALEVVLLELEVVGAAQGGKHAAALHELAGQHGQLLYVAAHDGRDGHAVAGWHVNLARSLHFGTEVTPGEGANLNASRLHLRSIEKHLIGGAGWGRGGLVGGFIGFAAAGDEEGEEGDVGEGFHGRNFFSEDF